MAKNKKVKNGLIIDDDGTKRWYKDGLLHSDNDLPAVEYNNGSKVWYQHGEIHRENDLPAIDRINGDKYWYQYDKLHRDNGLPAIINFDGTEEYWENDEKLTQEESLRRKEVRDLKQTLTNTLPESSMKSPFNKI